jgi:hypothetical protein
VAGKFVNRYNKIVKNSTRKNRKSVIPVAAITVKNYACFSPSNYI